MTYQFEVSLHEAKEISAGRAYMESDDDYNARVIFQENKSLFRLVMVDLGGDKPKQFAMMSPLFLTGDEQAQWSVLAQLFKETKKAMVQRERDRPRIVV